MCGSPGPQNYNLIKKRLQHRFFPVKFASVLRTPCFTEHPQWLLLTFSGFRPTTLLKNDVSDKCFSVNFANVLRASFYRTPQDDCFLCLSVNFEKFFRTLLLQSTSWKPLTSCTCCRISTTIYRKKNYLTDAFQASCTGMRSSHLKAFIYFKSLKIICEEANL